MFSSTSLTSYKRSRSVPAAAGEAQRGPASLDAGCPGPSAPGAGPGKIKCVCRTQEDNITDRTNRASISDHPVFRDPGAIVSLIYLNA